MSRLTSYRAVILVSTLALTALPAGARHAGPSPAGAGILTARLGLVLASANPQPGSKAGIGLDPVGVDAGSPAEEVAS